MAPVDRRIFGLENEYGVTCTLRGQRRLSPDEVARYLFRRVVSWGRSSNVFLRAVIGGMVARMALMLGAVVLAILYLGLPKLPLTISLLSYFMLFLIFELRVLHKHTQPRTEAQAR